jgi:hypothetical protein
MERPFTAGSFAMREKFVGVELLEQRRLMSVSFSSADLNGTWALNGMGAQGTIQFDGTGNIVGGTVSDDSGDTDTPSGTYSVSNIGATNLDAEGTVSNGALNASKNLVAGTSGTNDSLYVLTNSGTTSFSTSSLSGTWYGYGNGSKTAPDGSSVTHGNSGHATFSFNGSGGFSANFVSDAGSPTENFSGSYTVSSSGAVSIDIMGPDNSSQIYAGSINASGNAVVLNPPSLATAATDNAARMFVLISPSGTYSKTSLDGTWTIVFDKGEATLNFNGAGKVTGTVAGLGAISGKYTVASNGTFTITLNKSAATGNQPLFYAGSIAGSHNVAAMDQPKGGANDDLAVMIASEPVEHAPTLTKIATLKTATAGQPFTISYAALLAASNAADIDGDPIIFKIESIGIGTFLLDGSRPVLGADFTSGDLITWTPTATTKGNFAAFSVKAFDGTDVSLKSVAVKVAIAKAPKI